MSVFVDFVGTNLGKFTNVFVSFLHFEMPMIPFHKAVRHFLVTFEGLKG